MKKIDIVLFLTLFIFVAWTFFAIQNKVLVPVRFLFNEPKLYFLHIIVLVSFVAGAVAGVIIALIAGSSNKPEFLGIVELKSPLEPDMAHKHALVIKKEKSV